uniref:Ig-like domain-containing protein n=1 Tax=Anopheles melas TaxID=34690 RepID=A0A182TKB9_9DIPT
MLLSDSDAPSVPRVVSSMVSHSVLGLESVHIQVPVAVLVGTSATLICECDLPDDELYSVKWYKGKHEFFRYTSKEIPSIKIFPKAGISVNVNESFDTKHRLILPDMNYFPEKKCR